MHLVHMAIKLLHNLYQVRHQKPHLNNRLLFLSPFQQHNLNLHHLPRKRQHQVILFCRVSGLALYCVWVCFLPPLCLTEKDVPPTNSLKHTAASHRMPQHQSLGAVGGGSEACRSSLKVPGGFIQCLLLSHTFSSFCVISPLL